MKTMLISNVTIADSKKDSVTGDVFIENGEIIEVAASINKVTDIRIDATGKNWIVVPGFIDVHIHGSSGFDVMDSTPEALNGLASALPREGTTSFLATTMTQSEEAISEALVNASLFNADKMQAEMLGVHLEGPFISAIRAGAQPIEHITTPSFSLFEKWQALSGNRIKIVTVAPEVEDGLAFVEEVTASGVIASLGHTDATSDVVRSAVEVGASHVTHLYNQMSLFHHREPGVVGAAFLEDSLTVEIIVDLIHSHPKSVELAFRQKASNRIILITDAMRAKGLPPGTYDLGGQAVEVTHKDARLADGTLAGSILTMENAAKNMKSITNCTLSELVAMTSTNAADQLGLSHKGRIEPGKDADITIIDGDWNVQMTICKGNIAYAKEVIE
ncbi:N-acetylglucosamine-6-phosphate deacetylase [Sporosarcina sp. ANT_H38]|uniref:N-acetylglucosamine-6-phosphate deacetylase n=1 Tax=Sporosarcina sp. ANT_H38 TaxID=2597358 RepID=UPI0011F22359|nr:N-acetylglucosamine-6-phosphate deacetylase [Sporosarcina sp. ANT_H38]KAA0965316.1 N-acetylglucosamine-6-phosphate deacetylase [Sporosarcina sp. ANT_H38]